MEIVVGNNNEKATLLSTVTNQFTSGIISFNSENARHYPYLKYEVKAEIKLLVQGHY